MLQYSQHIVPYEVAAEQAGRRLLKTFPPYSLGFEANLARHLEIVAQAVRPVDPGRSWIDPFGKFLAVSEHLWEHYRELAGIDFEGALLLHWVLDSIITCCRVHVALLDNPPVGAEHFLGGLEKALRRLIYCVGFFFPADKFQGHAEVATDGIAKVGMKLLWGGHPDLALICGEVVARITANSALALQRGYIVVNHLRNLEILARAAEAMDQDAAAARFRGMVTKPDAISPEDWERHQQDLTWRIRQMDEALEQYVPEYALRDDPESMLRRILIARSQREDE